MDSTSVSLLDCSADRTKVLAEGRAVLFSCGDGRRGIQGARRRCACHVTGWEVGRLAGLNGFVPFAVADSHRARQQAVAAERFR